MDGVLDACRKEIRGRAAIVERHIGNTGIASINDHGGAYIGIGTRVQFVDHSVTVGVPTTTTVR